MSTNRYAQLAVLLCAATLLLTGCGGDSGVSQSAHSQLQDALDAALAAHEAEEEARQQAEASAAAERTAREEAEAAQATAEAAQQEAEQEAEEAEQAAQAAEQARQQAQAEADAQRQRAQTQEQEEADAESITRAYGLLEAMDPRFRGALSTDATNIDRSDANAKLGTTHPLDNTQPEASRISNNAPTIRESANGSLQLTVMSDGARRVPEFTAGGGIPSLSLGGASLSSRVLRREDASDNAEQLAVYTNFKARNMRLLDLYTDYRRLDGTDKTNEIQLGNDIANPTITAGALTTAGSVNVDEKMRDNIRTRSADMYSGLQEVPAVQPRLSGVTYEQAPYILDTDDDYRVSFELASEGADPDDTDDDTYTVVKSFSAALRGVSGRIQVRGNSPVDPDDGESAVDNDDSICTTTPSAAACVAFAEAFTPTFTINTRPEGTSTNPVRYEPSSYELGTEGTWTFVPSSTGSTVWVDDSHYLYFGWWQGTPDQADGVYDFHVFADGVGRWGAGFLNRANSQTAYNLDNTQTNVVYTGPAVGKYVRTVGAHDELDHAGERRREAVDGIFTANARLQANFATPDVKGTVTNFVDDASGQPIPGRWQVILGSGDTANVPNIVPAAGITFGTSGSDLSTTPTPIAVIKQIGQGGGEGALPSEAQTGQQTWEVIFFADELAGPNTSAVPPQPSVPASAVGRFDVGLRGVIHFSGAFGVTKN